MSDKITTLHLESDPTINVYPNIRTANIPDDGVTPQKLSSHTYRHDATLIYQGRHLQLRLDPIIPLSTAINDPREFISRLYDIYGVGTYIPCHGYIDDVDIVEYIIILSDTTIEIHYIDVSDLSLNHTQAVISTEYSMNDIVTLIY